MTSVFTLIALIMLFFFKDRTRELQQARQRRRLVEEDEQMELKETSMNLREEIEEEEAKEMKSLHNPEKELPSVEKES